MVYEHEGKFAEAKPHFRKRLSCKSACTGRATRTWRLRSSEKLLATTHLALAIAYDGLDLSNEPEEHYRKKALELQKRGVIWRTLL